jgi:hypothetical protein
MDGLLSRDEIGDVIRDIYALVKHIFFVYLLDVY